MGDLDQVTHFMDGLKPAPRMKVSYQAPANLEDTWKLAIQYDTAMFGVGKFIIKKTSSVNNNKHKDRDSLNSHQDTITTPYQWNWIELKSKKNPTSMNKKRY